MVIWERLDRVLGYKKPDGESARKQLNAMCRELEEHLAMVFHRFLAGEVRGRKLAIYLNNNKVTPWDPFARSESGTQKLEAVVLRLEGENGRSDVIVEPFVLPPQSKFSNADAFNRASGPNKWNRQQGFYIYRADRMIQSGGWSNLRTLDEHNKLARVALSFSPRADDDFKINVPKMRVSLPADIRDDVAKAIGPVIKLANAAYRAGERGGKPPAVPPPTPSSKPASSGGGASATSTPPPPASGGGNGTEDSGVVVGASANGASQPQGGIDIDHVGILLERVAKPDELPVIQRVVARAKATFGA